MRRRTFLTWAGGAAAWPLAAHAQDRVSPAIGVLNSGSAALRPDLLDAFYAGLKQSGYIVGQNVVIEFRGADDHYERLPALALEFVRRPVSIIAAVGGPATALAAKAATANIPIVFPAVSDPVRSGLVASMNRPGGNVTGLNALTAELDPKRIEMLHELVPAARTLGALVNPNRPGVDGQIAELENAARKLGLPLTVMRTGDAQNLDAAFAHLAGERIEALLVAADPFFNNHRAEVVSLAARHAIPAMYQWREFTMGGGFASYGPSLVEAYRQAAIYIGRILKGEKPAELPVVQPTKFELVINLKTAKSLGLTVPPTLMARADEVIE